MLCHSFIGCALPPSLLFHALFLSPIQTHKVASTIFWRDNQKITGLGRKILYNIQPLNPTLYWSHWRPWGRQNSSPGVPGGHHALTCLGIWSSKVCHASTYSGICQSQGVPGGSHTSTCPGTQFSGGCHASTCLGIRSLGGCHASACLGICTLTRARLALRLQQY